MTPVAPATDHSVLSVAPVTGFENVMTRLVALAVAAVNVGGLVSYLTCTLPAGLTLGEARVSAAPPTSAQYVPTGGVPEYDTSWMQSQSSVSIAESVTVVPETLACDAVSPVAAAYRLPRLSPWRRSAPSGSESSRRRLPTEVKSHERSVGGAASLVTYMPLARRLPAASARPSAVMTRCIAVYWAAVDTGSCASVSVTVEPEAEAPERAGPPTPQFAVCAVPVTGSERPTSIVLDDVRLADARTGGAPSIARGVGSNPTAAGTGWSSSRFDESSWSWRSKSPSRLEAWSCPWSLGCVYATSGVAEVEVNATCSSVICVVGLSLLSVSADRGIVPMVVVECDPARTCVTVLATSAPSMPTPFSVTVQAAGHISSLSAKAWSVPLTGLSNVTTVVLALVVRTDVISGAGETKSPAVAAMLAASSPPPALLAVLASLAGSSLTSYLPLLSGYMSVATTVEASLPSSASVATGVPPTVSGAVRVARPPASPAGLTVSATPAKSASSASLATRRTVVPSSSISAETAAGGTPSAASTAHTPPAGSVIPPMARPPAGTVYVILGVEATVPRPSWWTSRAVPDSACVAAAVPPVPDTPETALSAPVTGSPSSSSSVTAHEPAASVAVTCEVNVTLVASEVPPAAGGSVTAVNGAA